MALVAFPFTCITSEDIEDDSLHGPYTMLTAQPTSSETSDGETGEACLEEEGESTRSNRQDHDSNAATEPSPSTTEVVAMEIDEGERATTGTVDVEEMEIVTETTASSDTTTSAKAEDKEEFQGYGGLRNLGNTCYMNSALQMIASLDHFVEELEREEPPMANHDNNMQQQQDAGAAKSVRQAFLETLAALRRGETVSPGDFKRPLDERTSLFLGFRQEDSHEFLTTLLDMLDEDYKVKPDESKKEEKASGNEQEETKQEAKAIEAESDNTQAEQSSEESTTSNQEHDSAESPQTESCEPQATTEAAEPEVESQDVESTPCPNGTTTKLSTCQSFSDLQPDGIEELLYARLLDKNYNFDTAVAPASPPRCKLAGGRMASLDLHDTVVIHEEEGEPVASVANEEEEAQSTAQAQSECSEPSPVESYFKTEVRVRLTCDSCKFTRSHVENFLHLSLEIGEDSGCVADGLRKFFAPEKRDIKCEKCFCESAMQTMEITRLPRALLLHFKRFIVDISDDYTSITYRKNQSDFQFDDKLSLEGVLAECCSQDVIVPNINLHSNNNNSSCRCGTYDIRSVVNHIGSSAACGHYTADALREYPGQTERQWTRFNDSFVSNITANEAINNSFKTAYLTMYELS